METAFSLMQRILDFALPFSWAKPIFMKNALLAMMLIAPLTSMLGVHITSFRMAFYSDAVSHSAFTGIALGLLFSINPVLMIIVFALVVGAAIIRIERKTQITADNIISVIMSIGMALGIAIIGLKKSRMIEFQNYLFGDILTIGQWEIALTAAVLIVVAGFMFSRFNRLTLLSFNRSLAVNRYSSVDTDKIVFLMLVTLVVAISIKIIGILLVTSLLVIPSVSARLVSRNTGSTFWISFLFTAAACVGGLVTSYYLDISTSAVIILILSVFFICSYAFSRNR